MYEQSFVQQSKPKRRIPFIVKCVIAAVALLVALVLFFAPTTTVGDGYTGVLYHFGEVRSTDVGKGLKFHTPFIESIEKVDTKEQLVEGTANAYTSDGQVIENIEYSTNYSYDLSKMDSLIRNVQTKLIYPNVNSIMKNVIGKSKRRSLFRTDLSARSKLRLTYATPSLPTAFT